MGKRVRITQERHFFPPLNPLVMSWKGGKWGRINKALATLIVSLSLSFTLEIFQPLLDERRRKIPES